MTGTYTQQNIDSARSVFGDDPSAVARGVAATMTQSPTFQEPIQGQAGAIDALQQIKDYDMQLASQVNQGNTAQMQTGQAQTANLAAFGALGATPQETIAKAQGELPATEIRTPTSGLLSPFVASGLASGQSKAATDTYDTAAQTRSALTTAVGSEAKAYSDAIKYENDLKALEEKKKQQEFDNALNIAKLTGSSSFVNPIDGKSYNVSTTANMTSSEKERAGIIGNLEADIAGRMTPKDLFAKYSDSGLTFNDIMTKYNQSSPWGPAKESMEELRTMYEGNPQTTATLKQKEDERKLTGDLISAKIDQLKDLSSDYTVFSTMNPWNPKKDQYNVARRELASLMARIKNPSRSPTDADVELELVKIPDSPLGLQGKKDIILDQLKTDALGFLGQSTDPYSEFRSQLQPGESLYINNATGELLAVPDNEPVPSGIGKL